PSSEDAQQLLAGALEATVGVMMANGDRAGATGAVQEAIAARRRSAAMDPTNVSVGLQLTTDLEAEADLFIAQGDFDKGYKAGDEAIATARRLAASNPTDAGLQGVLSMGLMTAGLASAQKKDYPTAQDDLEAALAIDRKLSAADPTNGVLQRKVAYALAAIAALPGGKEHWSDVVAEWRTISDKGALTTSDQTQLDLAQQRAAAEGGSAPPTAKAQP
ncbi:MAG TPA: hypothetical protein VME40_09485, partial [Caulobacteraceae bacterium]|nr:hypothetical protein [Caulobacteraceae bacterium]